MTPIHDTGFVLSRKWWEVEESPAFVIDLAEIGRALRPVIEIAQNRGCHVLFPLKASSVSFLLRYLGQRIDGFSASSLFEAILARDILGKKGTVHLTTPGIRSDEIDQLSLLCDYISFNSIIQWERFGSCVSRNALCGLRINPQIRFVGDERYDPCRRHSKLGVPIEQLSSLSENMIRLRRLSGFLFHTNCDSSDFAELRTTFKHIERHAKRLISKIDWVNLGGGYLFEGAMNVDAFCETVTHLRCKYDLDVFIEPGAAIVRNAGYLVASVLDLFESSGKTVAVLDTTVNHWPEVFEYQFEPDVLGHVEGGQYGYILAGCSCLAGDVFGEYAFDQPLEVGSKVVFANAGAYSLVKAHMFNGINLPTIYTLTETGELVMRREFTYNDFASRCGVNGDVTV